MVAAAFPQMALQGPRETRTPDAEGWWARRVRDTRQIEWHQVVHVEDPGLSTLGIWQRLTHEFIPVAKCSGPDVEWYGPILLPWVAF